MKFSAKYCFQIVLTFILFLVFCQTGKAQIENDTTALWKIVLIDDNVYFGEITDHDEEEIKLSTIELGVISIKRAYIKNQVFLDQKKVRKGEYWEIHTQSIQYALGTNALSLKKGEGYFQNAQVLFNQGFYGLSDRIDLGIGFVPFNSIVDNLRPVWIAPKISFPTKNKKLHFSTGAYFFVLTDKDFSSNRSKLASVIQGITTFGNRNLNMSIGLGYGFIRENWLDRPTITFSVLARSDKSFYFLTENFFIKDPRTNKREFLSFLGGRKIVSNKVSMDFGFMVTNSFITSEIITALPWFNLSIPFGGKPED